MRTLAGMLARGRQRWPACWPKPHANAGNMLAKTSCERWQHAGQIHANAGNMLARVHANAGNMLARVHANAGQYAGQSSCER